MRSAYRILALLIVAGVFIQAASVAFGWFDVIHDLDDGGTLSKNSDRKLGHVIHGTVGMMVIPLLALLLFIVSFFAKIPGGVKRAGFVLLAVVAQVALAIGAFAIAPVIGALHGMNALVIIGLSLMAARRATAAEPATATHDDAVGAHAG